MYNTHKVFPTPFTEIWWIHIVASWKLKVHPVACVFIFMRVRVFVVEGVLAICMLWLNIGILRWSWGSIHIVSWSICLLMNLLYLSAKGTTILFANFVMSLFLLTTLRQFFFFYCLMVYHSFPILLVIISIYDSAYLELRWLFCRFATRK